MSRFYVGGQAGVITPGLLHTRLLVKVIGSVLDIIKFLKHNTLL